MGSDSLDAIRDVLNLQNPTQQLLELIRACPEFPTIRDIVVIYFELARQSPSSRNKLARILVDLKNSTEITIATYDRLSNPVQIPMAVALDLALQTLLRTRLDVTPVTPSNRHLIVSLLSAVAMRHSLCRPGAFFGAVHCGLYYEGDRYCIDVAAHQGLVLGACLQLSMNGSHLCGPTGQFDVRSVLDALERIQNSGVVKHHGGQRLLKITIQQAKDGFKSDVDDSWSILFPS